MTIDDILREKQMDQTAPAARSVTDAKKQLRQEQSRDEPEDLSSDDGPSAGIRTSSGTIRLELPDPTDGDREAMLFWLNVFQTLALLYLLVRR